MLGRLFNLRQDKKDAEDRRARRIQSLILHKTAFPRHKEQNGVCVESSYAEENISNREIKRVHISVLNVSLSWRASGEVYISRAGRDPREVNLHNLSYFVGILGIAGIVGIGFVAVQVIPQELRRKGDEVAASAFLRLQQATSSFQEVVASSDFGQSFSRPLASFSQPLASSQIGRSLLDSLSSSQFGGGYIASHGGSIVDRNPSPTSGSYDVAAAIEEVNSALATSRMPEPDISLSFIVSHLAEKYRLNEDMKAEIDGEYMRFAMESNSDGAISRIVRDGGKPLAGEGDAGGLIRFRIDASDFLGFQLSPDECRHFVGSVSSHLQPFGDATWNSLDGNVGEFDERGAKNACESSPTMILNLKVRE